MTKKLSFQNVLEHLLDSKKDIPHGHLPYYSDMDPQSLRLMMDVWSGVKPARKVQLLDTLLLNLKTDTIASYEELGRALLKDPEADVRARAIRLLVEDNDPYLIPPFLDILLHDPEIAPRVEAARQLGEFVLLGELDELDEEQKTKIENALIQVAKGEDEPPLRRQALESLGYSSRAEASTLIESAYERADPAWVASALRAMGRSHDEERWRDEVLGKLLDPDPRIRLAAVNAAGELLIEDAGPVIIRMLEDEEEDDDITAAAIWSLSEIGGEDARVYLVSLLENTEDEDAVEYLEEALENLDFNEELNKFDLLDVEEDDLEDEGK